MALSKKEQSYINVATEEALKSEVLMRIGCVAVMNGKIVSKAHNSYRNRTYDGFVAENQCTCHAEMAALRGVFRGYCGNTYGKWMEALKVASCSKVI
jgi:hypothetical protein